MRIEFGKYNIREWSLDDVHSLVKYANNRKIWLNLRDGFPHPYKTSDAYTFITRVNRQSTKTVFAIATEKEAIGSIGLLLGVDVHRFSAELGYWMAEPFWNKGIISEAIFLFSEYAINKYKLNRIFAEPYANNPASAKALEKAGFTLEGTMKAHAFKDGKVMDMFLYAKVPDNIR